MSFTIVSTSPFSTAGGNQLPPAVQSYNYRTGFFCQYRAGYFYVNKQLENVSGKCRKQINLPSDNYIRKMTALYTASSCRLREARADLFRF